jgi:hypothetical protein
MTASGESWRKVLNPKLPVRTVSYALRVRGISPATGTRRGWGT